ncbi:DUF1264 domain-containing protein [Candidatus Nitrotoga sp. M5]|uniref:DUF1264 domain-containing protein n=1 Tax=Candidatus Nitrotoga sp. M5 TaxID=2890409 RepID=UPI001EF2D2AC|nr:DUF1264 domain-containing protein [Candidatus Nitrotoga sp. M5]CAH1386535.1 exported hypothetical protein [Candidatus Nitrotoga sp. M5]
MKIKKVCVLVSSLIAAGFLSAPAVAAANGPLAGYTIHVAAPHVMNGEIMGPYHHYCKAINADIIQCILFESTQPNARMTEVEYMVSKRLARTSLPKWSHTQNWHDHQEEIDTGRVAIINPTDPKEQEALAKYVGNTDGIIFHLWPEGAPIPDGSVHIPQSVGNWEARHGKIVSKGSSSHHESSHDHGANHDHDHGANHDHDHGANHQESSSSGSSSNNYYATKK